LVSGLDKIQAVMRVLEAAGIEFLNHGEPGVKLRRRPDQSAAETRQGDQP
jgi:hypothetical protein